MGEDCTDLFRGILVDPFLQFLIIVYLNRYRTTTIRGI